MYEPNLSSSNKTFSIHFQNGLQNNRSDIQSEPENPQERAKWGSSIEFLMSCIAMNVGLGNIWRFPFVAYENGGGAFLIPYLLVLIFLGRPMYYLEICLGQFSSSGNVNMFEKLAPILKGEDFKFLFWFPCCRNSNFLGIGYGQLIGTFSVATYYCSLMALTLYYLVNSFTSKLPWSVCDSSWKNTSWLENNVECLASNAENVNGSNNTVSSAELWFR